MRGERNGVAQRAARGAQPPAPALLVARAAGDWRCVDVCVDVCAAWSGSRSRRVRVCGGWRAGGSGEPSPAQTGFGELSLSFSPSPAAACCRFCTACAPAVGAARPSRQWLPARRRLHRRRRRGAAGGGGTDRVACFGPGSSQGVLLAGAGWRHWVSAPCRWSPPAAGSGRRPPAARRRCAPPWPARRSRERPAWRERLAVGWWWG